MPAGRLALASILVIVVALSGCAVEEPASGDDVRLTVFAAASLLGAMGEVASSYGAAHPRAELTLSTDSSAALATQIEQGAPADVFLSADTTNADRLAAAGLAAGDVVVFATNELAIIVPDGNPAGITSPADLARAGIRIVAAADAVPITRYAAALLANLANEPGYPPGFPDAYAANVVSREDNVRAVVAKIALGEGDAGIVYATDAASSSAIEVVGVPESANVSAPYAGVAVAGSEEPAAARAFLGWVVGPGGQGVLERYGFGPAPR